MNAITIGLQEESGCVNRIEVLMFGLSSYPGGIENSMVNVLCHESFPADRIRVTFVTYEDTLAFSDMIKRKGHRIKRVPHLKRHPLGYVRSIRKLLQTGRFDAVYVNMLTAANAAPVYAAKACGVERIILHAHASNTVSGFFRRCFHLFNRSSCAKCASLRLACSADAGNWLFGNREFSVIPNAIDCHRFKPSEENREVVRKKNGIGRQTLLIGHVGRFAPEKNHAFMLDILSTLLQNGIDANLMFIGDGATKEDIVMGAKKRGLIQYVHFEATTSEAEMYYPAFDVFLFPSSFEGFGVAALEAQSCGVPCVCSDMVPKTIDVTRTTRFISLSKSPEYWAKSISEIHACSREAMHRAVSSSAYNIDKQIPGFINLLKGADHQ